MLGAEVELLLGDAEQAEQIRDLASEVYDLGERVESVAWSQGSLLDS